VGRHLAHSLRVPGRFRKQLADYLRQRRGDMTYAQFARKVGLSSSTLQRLEMGEQNITIDTLEALVRRLKCRVTDVLSD